MNVEGHEFWAAESKSLKGCVAQGDTCEEALAELAINEEEWLTTAQEYGIEIPAVPFEKAESYSGKFTVRVSPAIHQAAAEQARRLGISLNQYVNDAIVTMNTKELLKEGIKIGCETAKMGMRASITTKTQTVSFAKFDRSDLVLSTKAEPIYSR